MLCPKIISLRTVSHPFNLTRLELRKQKLQAVVWAQSNWVFAGWYGFLEQTTRVCLRDAIQ